MLLARPRRHRLPSLYHRDTPEREVSEIDHVPMVAMARIGVDFLAANIGIDALGIARVLILQRAHRREVRGFALRRRDIVKGEAHAEYIGAHESLKGIGS